MMLTLLKAKIHRATVTEADLHYVGSITIDCDLMDAVGIIDNEQVDVYDITNGNRLTTYAIPGERGSGTICINGAAAHLVREGDLVIIACYALFNEEEAARHVPRIAHVDSRNQIISLDHDTQDC